MVDNFFNKEMEVCDKFGPNILPKVASVSEPVTWECPPIEEFEDFEEFPQISLEDYSDLIVATRIFWNTHLTREQRQIIAGYRSGNYAEINNYFSSRDKKNIKLERAYHILMSIFTHPSLPIVSNTYVYRMLREYDDITNDDMPETLKLTRPTSTTFSFGYVMSLYRADPDVSICKQIDIKDIQALCIGAFDEETEWELLLPPGLILQLTGREIVDPSLAEYLEVSPKTTVWCYEIL